MSCERGLCGSGHGPLRCAPAVAVPPAARVRADVRHQPFGRIMKSGHFLGPRPTAKGGPVMVLALALPLIMMAALFALDAFENWLFPPPSLPGTHPLRTPRKTSHPDDGSRAAHQPVAVPHQATASQSPERSLNPQPDRNTALRGRGPHRRRRSLPRGRSGCIDIRTHPTRQRRPSRPPPGLEGRRHVGPQNQPTSIQANHAGHIPSHPRHHLMRQCGKTGQWWRPPSCW